MCACVCVLGTFMDLYRSLTHFQPKKHCDMHFLFPVPPNPQLYWRFRVGGQSYGLVQGSDIPAHIVIGRFIFHGSLDTIGQKAEDGTDPQKDREAPEKLATELDPLRGCWGWSEGVGSISSQNVLGSLVGEALREARKRVGSHPEQTQPLTTFHQLLGGE